MKTIKIEEDLFEDLLSEVVQSGKSFSGVIREWQQTTDSDGEGTSPRFTRSVSDRDEELETFVQRSNFQAQRTAIKRYLSVLSFTYEQNIDDFDQLLGMGGTRRKYIGQSYQELEKHGTDVRPERIPNTPFWTITRLSNDQKRKILREALQRLDYDARTARKVSRAVC